ncbi:class I SAM-dependent methyltransferase [Candidatus Saccharibacteria bacterium]|nr:class I SAM-dependent methyltransferase [Candidatus Saccharibacteria bacterium]
MAWLFWTLFVILLCFGVVLLVGAPYLPTMKKQVQAGLDLLDLKPGQTMLELGCGDGKVLIAAAQRGIVCVGYELNPILAAISWLRTRRFGRRVRVVWGDYWRTEWPTADGIYAFILPKYMPKLDTKITQLKHNSVRLVSIAFPIDTRKPAKSTQGLYLYVYK